MLPIVFPPEEVVLYNSVVNTPPSNQLPGEKTAGRDLSRIPFGWDSTTAPELPFPLPISVEMEVTQDALRLRVFRQETMGELLGMDTNTDMNLEFPRDTILGVEIFIMPDVADDADWQWVREADLSWVIVRHRDPFEVEPYFESIFTSAKGYWPKALAKMLKEKMGLQAAVTVEDQERRKLRLIRQST